MYRHLLCWGLLCLAASLAHAQTPTPDAADTAQAQSPWVRSGSANLTFSNVGLSNWAGGGVSSVSLGAVVNLQANRETDKSIWTNQLDLAFGLISQEGQEFRKTDDNLTFRTQYGYKLTPRWSIAGMAQLRTQFAQGFRFEDDPNNPGEERSVLISNIMAPGFLTTNIGSKYTYEKIFTATISPLTGKFTFVLDEELSEQGVFGVPPGDHVRREIGSNLEAELKLQVMKNVRFQTDLTLFANYENYGSWDVNWNTLLVFKVNDYINTTFGTQLIYDDDIAIQQDNGDVGPAVQFKNALTIGIGVSF